MCNYLKIIYIFKRSVYLENNIKQLTSSIFSAAIPRVIFTLSLMLTPEGKYQISTFDKSMVIHQFECYCDNSYNGLTTRQLKKRVKEHISACVDNFLK